MKIKKERVLTFGLVLLFVLLIFKDPFSQRTLIPNLEPHPDTFTYINPALNFVKGNGFNVNRQGRVIKPHVPPLYSISLIPSFVVRSDPRMAYYTNVVLALVSLFLFRAILRKILINRLVIYLLLILYITNYFIYWVPTLVMAENLTLALFLGAIFFLLSKLSKINLFILATLTVSMYATKYASISISITLISLCLLKILLGKSIIKQKIQLALCFISVTTLFCFLIAVFEQTTKGNSIISQAVLFLSLIYDNTPSSNSGSAVVSNSWFGIQYINQNLPLYINSLLGRSNRFLWDNTPLVPNIIALTGLAGIIGGFFRKQFRFISFSLFAFTVTTIIFMSTFYSFDARYIYIVIPILFIGFGLFLGCLADKAGTNKNLIVNFLAFIFVCIYLISSFTRIKSQISLNLRYAETPWYYISVLKMNEYFTKDKIVDSKKPVLISALPPFLIDYYTNENYSLLPLSYEQEFRGQETRQIVWGPNDYSDLPKLYKKYLDTGYDVYVSRAGLGNEGYTNEDFNTIIKNFATQLVQSGCFDQCNIYSVKLKDKNDE